MDVDAELARFNPDPALANWIIGALEQLTEQAQQQAAQASAEAARLAEQIARRDAELHAAQIKIQALTLELAHHRRLRFGIKSEALTGAQRDLFEEAWSSDLGALQAELERQCDALKPDRPKRTRAGRQPLPEHLPRIEHRHEPQSCTCERCGKQLVKIGEDVSEQLDVEPARFFVHRRVNIHAACKLARSVGHPALAAAPARAAPGYVAGRFTSSRSRKRGSAAGCRLDRQVAAQLGGTFREQAQSPTHGYLRLGSCPKQTE